MKFNLFLVTITLLLITLTSAADVKKCRALCLEGGGDSGSWEAGVLQALVEKLPAEEVAWDIISGVSVGALNGFFISSYPKGEEKQMAKDLQDFWRQMNKDKAYTSWGWGYLGLYKGFTSKPSLFDNTPLKELIEDLVKKRTIQRKLTIGVTDATHVTSISYKANTLTQEQLSKAILASTSMPFVFPYMKTDDALLVDGGVLFNVDVESAIDECRAMGFSDENIVIDVILPTGAQISEMDPNKFYTGWEMYKRYKEMTAFKFALEDIVNAIHDFPKIDFRYIFIKLKYIPSD